MKYLFLTFLFFWVQIACAQNKGIIKGKVTDENVNNEPVAFANVAIYKINLKNPDAETELIDGTSTDENGDYYIPNIPAGIYVVEFSYIDFPIPLKIVNVQIKSKGITPLDCKYPKESEQRNARYYSSPYEHFLNPQSVNIGKPDAAYRQSNGVFVASKIVHR